MLIVFRLVREKDLGTKCPQAKTQDFVTMLRKKFLIEIVITMNLNVL